MRLEFDPQIASDISCIMDYYEGVEGPQLADEFYAELRAAFQKAADNPERFSIRERDPQASKPREIPVSLLVSGC